MSALMHGGSLALFLVLGAVHPRVKAIGLVHKDLILNVANGALLFGLSVTGVAWVKDHTMFGLIDMSFLTAPWAQFLLSIVLLDFVRYWLHYAHHRVPFLWNFHRVHHGNENLDASAGLRMHVVDFVQLSAIPIGLFGVLMDISNFAEWVVPAALGVGIAMDCFEHGNIAVDTNSKVFKVWNLLLNNPHFHSWHHTRDGSRCDGNYGNTFVIWDRIFKTEVTGPEPPDLYGLEDSKAVENSILGWLLLRPRPPRDAETAQA